jgi:hypothetical protein
VNTLLRLAAAFDVALLIKFVPFRKLLDEFSDLSTGALQVNSFDDELQVLENTTATTSNWSSVGTYTYEPLTKVGHNQAVYFYRELTPPAVSEQTSIPIVYFDIALPSAKVENPPAAEQLPGFFLSANTEVLDYTSTPIS